MWYAPYAPLVPISSGHHEHELNADLTGWVAAVAKATGCR